MVVTSGWAALNTLRERCPHMPGEPCDCPSKDAALARLQTALEAAEEAIGEDMSLDYLDPDDPEVMEEYHRNFSEKQVAAAIALRAAREGK